MTYAMKQAIGAYQTAAATVAPPVAVALLLDEVLNAVVLAAEHRRNGEHEQAFMRIQRAIGILRGLRQNVDLECDRELGDQLIEMYTHNIFALNAAFGAPNSVEQYVVLASGLLEFRNSWAEMTSLSSRNLDVLTNEIVNQRPANDELASVDTA